VEKRRKGYVCVSFKGIVEECAGCAPFRSVHQRMNALEQESIGFDRNIPTDTTARSYK